ncbi:MAG: hypothetical protein GEV08_12995 [Acidimicrobiia bacterium]|nr:hypothetical protein [Acidimicrobiia bacterium]
MTYPTTGKLPTVPPPPPMPPTPPRARHRRRREVPLAYVVVLCLLTGVVGGLAGALLAGGGDDGTGPVAATSGTPAPSPTTSSTGPTTTVPAPTDAVPTTAVPTTAAPPAPTTTVAPGPAGLVADFAWEPAVARAGQSLRLVDRSTGEPTRWNWVWNGNNINVSGRSPNVATSFSRDTTVTLTACRRPVGGGPEECSTATKVVAVTP